MCNILGTQKTRTTPLRPQSDGMVERFNRTLETMLTLFTSENQKDWDTHLPQLMMAYRSSQHETTGRSPCEMMLGRSIRLPIDLMLGPTPVEDTGETSTEYASRLTSKMENIHKYAREHLDLESRRQKRTYDVRLYHKPYSRGDTVWLHNKRRKKGRSPKLSRSWEGPYLVLKALSDLVYSIQKSARSKPKVVHCDRLKPYRGSSIVSWLDHSTPVASPQVQPVVASETVTAEGPPQAPARPEPTLGRSKSGRPRRRPAWMQDYVQD